MICLEIYKFQRRKEKNIKFERRAQFRIMINQQMNGETIRPR